jgi:hypothetical protein
MIILKTDSLLALGERSNADLCLLMCCENGSLQIHSALALSSNLFFQVKPNSHPASAVPSLQVYQLGPLLLLICRYILMHLLTFPVSNC